MPLIFAAVGVPSILYSAAPVWSPDQRVSQIYTNAIMIKAQLKFSANSSIKKESLVAVLGLIQCSI